jgi:acetyltransferase
MEEKIRLANLKRLLAPKSVAIVGASNAPDKAGYAAVDGLKRFRGAVYPVNPKADEILGRKAYPSLSAIGQPADLVIFAIPAAACVEAVREAIACGCGGGLIVSGGFAESGPEGAAIQDQILKLCQSSGFRLLGPNTAGFVNMSLDLMATFAAGRDDIKPGRVAVVSQSSGINFVVTFAIHKLGLGVSAAIGVGNSIDTDISDVLEFLAEDEGTSAIAIHIEGIPTGRRLHDTLKRVTPKKPVVALVVGREDVAEFAQSHTGNLVGSYDLKVNALRQAGAVTVDTTEELAAAAALLSLERLPAKQTPGIGVLTGQGGAGVIMLDVLKGGAIAVPTLGEATAKRLSELLPPMTYMKNPVDTARPGPTFPDVLAAIGADPVIDSIIVFALSEPTLDPLDLVPAARKATGKPIIFGTSGSDAGVGPTITALRAQGFFVAENPERLAKAAVVLAQDSQMQWRLAQPADRVNVGAAPKAMGGLDEDASKSVLDGLGIATPQRAACSTRAEAMEAFRKLPKPLVAKILTSEIAHKTEAGGVHLKLADEAAFTAALDALDKIPLKGARRYLIEAMAPAGVELIVGSVRDASFGPTIMVGIGGTIAEAIKDTSTRLAPITKAEAEEMLSELRASALLDGWRGAPKVDRGALADAIVRLAAVLDAQPGVKEIEINPLRAYPDGVLALDALIV